MERRIKLLTFQRITSVAFQGERGAYSEQAARKFFKKKIALLPVPTFEGVFKLVSKRKADAGIVPIENSLQGSVLENYDHLQHFHVCIIGEVKLRIVHHLMANRGATLRTIRTVYSHPQALGQCGSFLRRLRNVECISYYDTAGAAKFVSGKKPFKAAAIASAEAAKAYGLKILARSVENNRKNYTRFLLLARSPVSTSVRAKTSIIFAVKNIPGSLYWALRAFALRRINLHKIESRPVIGKPWKYFFYLDCDGSVDDGPCAEAIKDLRKIGTYVKVLGSYPQG